MRMRDTEKIHNLRTKMLIKQRTDQSINYATDWSVNEIIK